MGIASLAPVLSHIEGLCRDTQPRQVPGHCQVTRTSSIEGPTFLGDICFSAGGQPTHAHKHLRALQRVESSHCRRDGAVAADTAGGVIEAVSR